MRLRTLVMMAAVGTGAWAADEGAAPVRSVTVCIRRDFGTPTYGAEKAVSEIFSPIGVRIDWRRGSCPAFLDVINLGFADEAPKGISPGALAYAHPYGGSIVVLYGRVKQQFCIQQLLPYVMAHEIAHILEGVSRHSAAGIMKAYWNGADYHAMVHKAMIFAPEDVDLIHAGMDSRADRMASHTRVQVAAR